MKTVVEVNDVSMRFNLAKEKVDNLKEYFIKLVKRQLHFEEFYALRNISFTIKEGDSFAIVGSNGSGKSTMLKLISRIYKPSEGFITVDGSVAPMIELGAGFDMELTARENVFLNGAVLGYNKEFMLDRYDEIIDFSELKEFEFVPLKNFSSGMRARLGFAVSTIIKPDILIVDEVLSVGDFKFKKKSEEKMKELMGNGTTLILVSHASQQVTTLCERAVWIDKGIMVAEGTSKEVCKLYEQS